MGDKANLEKSVTHLTENVKFKNEIQIERVTDRLEELNNNAQWPAHTICLAIATS
jgi:hypothetical protein